MKNIMIVAFLLGCVIVIGIGVAIIIIIDEPSPEDICKQDCEKLGHEYFKLKYGGFFSSSSCWCREGNRSIQIW